MAKKKGGRKKKSSARAKREVQEVHELPGGFWRQVLAVGMILIAIILVATWFGGGGEILNTIHTRGVEILGAAMYFIPVFLVYIAVRIFRSDTNKVPAVVWVASVLMIIWLSGLFGAATHAEAVPAGGTLGTGLNSVTAEILEPGVAVVIYVVLIFVTALFILQMSPAAVFCALREMFRIGEREEDAENADVARRAKDAPKAERKMGGLKINKGVETEEEEPEEAPRRGLRGKKKDLAVRAMKKEGGAKAEPEPEKALVMVSDPNWKAPSVDLLEKKQKPADGGNMQQNAFIIQSTLKEFGIEVEMEGANIGPRVTQYTMKPPAGVNLSKIVARDKELALNLAVDKIRIEAPIPGTRSVGVEIPNVRSADVRLRGVLESSEWKKATDPLTFAVGKDISGKAVVANLAKMPHLLIAGTTGSGKSVMTNTLISSLLYRNSPSELKLIIVDPKQVEMVQYNDIPHLLTPIINSTDKALSAMKWAVEEMERRYTSMSQEKVRNIVDYNKKMEKKAADGAEAAEAAGGKMPYIVIIIDEMADLMMMAGKDLEMLIVRIAQKGRAAGMHLVLATQRPEVKVITGLIKANVPARIAFAVGSSMDSRIMLDMSGAEKLLGKGDMLMLTTEMMGKPRRIQGAWASDEDVDKLTNFLREQRPPEYNNDVVSQPVQIKGMGPSDGGAIGDIGRKYDPNDPIVRKAVEISLSKGKFSTAMLQTYLGKGHGFVSGLAVWFEEIGVIGPQNGNKPRELLISSMDEFDTLVGL